MSNIKNRTEEEIIQDQIITLLLVRGTDKTICPSEVARELYPEVWREKMGRVREVAGELAKENVIIITQKNIIVNIKTKGPIRFKLKK